MCLTIFLTVMGMLMKVEDPVRYGSPQVIYLLADNAGPLPTVLKSYC